MSRDKFICLMNKTSVLYIPCVRNYRTHWRYQKNKIDIVLDLRELIDK